MYKLILILGTLFMLEACSTQSEVPSKGILPCEDQLKPYQNKKIAQKTSLPPAHSYQSFEHNDKLYAFCLKGTWESKDGKVWKKTGLPSQKKHAVQTRYIQFQEAVYALGQVDRIKESYRDLQFTSSQILKTHDFEKWQLVAEKSELPKLVEYELIVFKGQIYLIGGRDVNNKIQQSIWTSNDLIHWNKIAKDPPFRVKNAEKNIELLEFKGELYALVGNGKQVQSIWKTNNMQDWKLVNKNLHIPYFYSFQAFVKHLSCFARSVQCRYVPI